jgi:hypothetical protein
MDISLSLPFISNMAIAGAIAFITEALQSYFGTVRIDFTLGENER